jgi:hypothetical protein
MRKGILLQCLLLLLIITSIKAQPIQRNLLEKFSLPNINAALISKEKWNPFPKTTAQWKAALPDSVLQQLMKYGEEALGKPFLNIPATVTLEFLQNGNRGNYEKLSFAKRNQLVDLVLAESIEGKGRFVNQIVNGVWSICEESFWGATAHLGTQKAGSGLPDV